MAEQKANELEIDPIQADLEAWSRHGDKAAGRRAVLALQKECLPRIKRFMPDAGEDRWREELQEAVIHLCATARGVNEPPKALAPAGCESPRAWRMTVLKNFLKDRWKKLEWRLQIERAWGDQRSKKEFVEGRRRLREQRTKEREAQLRPFGHGRRSHGEAGDPSHRPEVDRVSDGAARLSGDDAEVGESASRAALRREAHEEALNEQIDSPRKRALVVASLPALPARRAMIVALGLRVDPMPFVDRLARDLHEDADVVRARVERARQDYDDPAALTDAMVRVLYPSQPLPTARDSARVLLENATAALQARHAPQRQEDE